MPDQTLGDTLEEAIEATDVMADAAKAKANAASAAAAAVTDDDDDAKSDEVLKQQAEEEAKLTAPSDNPEVDALDLSKLRGTKAPDEDHHCHGRGHGKPHHHAHKGAKRSEREIAAAEESDEEDLQNLAELLPGLKKHDGGDGEGGGEGGAQDAAAEGHGDARESSPKHDDGDEMEGEDQVGDLPLPSSDANSRSNPSNNNKETDDPLRWSTQVASGGHEIKNLDSMLVQNSVDEDDVVGKSAGEGEGEGEETGDATGKYKSDASQSSSSDSSRSSMVTKDDANFDLGAGRKNADQELDGFDGDLEDEDGGVSSSASDSSDADSSASRPPSSVDSSDDKKPAALAQHGHSRGKEPRMPAAPLGAIGGADGSGGGGGGGPAEEFRQHAHQSSAASLGTATATQTHEVRMPMYLPTFKPATGCTNASDFIVRCFVARLRSGITVVKHGRSRWCKSRLRILHVHSDGRSLSWKPALGEPSSSKRPPKLDLSTCMEVRHAWSPDPLNPMFTGTPILRQKCEAANAHKSFALIFPKRTVDITAVTADQCKVLMEGFSALCFRLQVANLAGRGKRPGAGGGEINSEEGDRTTVSVTLTNKSSTNLQQGSPAESGKVRRGSGKHKR